MEWKIEGFWMKSCFVVASISGWIYAILFIIGMVMGALGYY